MDRVYGLVVGLVTDVDDPEEQGRIKVRFPWLSPDTESGWAPIARPMAGKDRGYFYQPELEDEALVAFQHGDFNHPVVLGFLHSGVDLPPYQGIDKHVRRLRSVAGHVLELDDRDGEESVRLRTNGGHELELHDDSGYVELVTSGGQRLRMTDTPGRIELTTAGGTSIRMDDLPGQITLTATSGASLTISPTGGVSVDAPMSTSVRATTLDIDAALVRVNSGMAMFSGVVQCQTLIATTGVVSPSYTPGVGNIW